jgi:hypothetical protein
MTKDMSNAICVLIISALVGGLFHDIGYVGLTTASIVIGCASCVYLFLGYLDGKFSKEYK